jgi:hypothetical protein
MLLSALLLAQQLPPIALPAAASPQSLERADVDHVLVITLAYLQMDSQPLIPIEQGSIPLSGRPGLEMALKVPTLSDGSCPEQATLLVVADRRVPSFTTQILAEELKGSCFSATWMLVDAELPGAALALPKASEPLTLQDTLRVVPLSDEETGLYSLVLGPQGDTLFGGLPGPKAPGPPSAHYVPLAAEPLILGRMDSEAVGLALGEQEAALQDCANQAPAAGQVLMKLTVGADGAVSEVSVESGMQAPAAETCIVDVLKGLRLPVTEQGGTVVLPLTLSPQP